MILQAHVRVISKLHITLIIYACVIVVSDHKSNVMGYSPYSNGEGEWTNTHSVSLSRSTHCDIVRDDILCDDVIDFITASLGQ